MSDMAAAKEAARRVYKKYNFQDGPLGSYEISSLLKEVYEYLKIPFNPSQNDVKGYEKALDADRDGKVTLKDLETLAIEYLCGGGVSVKSGVAGAGAGAYSQTYKVPAAKQYDNMGYNYQLKSLDDPLSSMSGSGSQTKQYNYTQTYGYSSYDSKDKDYSAGTDKWASKNNGSELGQYQVPSNKDSYTVKYQQEYQINSNNYSYGGKPSQSYESRQEQTYVSTYGRDNSLNNNDGFQALNDWGGKTAISYAQSSNMGGTNSFSYNQAPNTSQQFNQDQSYRSSQYSEVVPSGYGYNLNGSGAQSNFESGAYDNQQRQYSGIVREYIKAIGELFMQYADNQSCTVTERQVPQLLSDTYAVLGRQGYYPTQQDVKAWMKLCDVNRDGKVDYQDYEYFVIKSLEKAGIDLYD